MKRLSKLIYTLAATLLITGAVWAQTHTMQATSLDPGAEGSVDIKRDKDANNAKVSVKVEHLASPTLLTPQAAEYVVWIQPQGEQAHNEGNLRVGDNERADMEFTTTASRFNVLVTAETEAHPQQPSNRVVLRADVQ